MRAFVLAVFLALVFGVALVPVDADAGGPRSGFYVGGPVGTFAPPPPPPGQAQPHFYIGGPVGTFAPPAPVQRVYPAAPYGYAYSCVAPGYWTYLFVPDPVSDGYYEPVWVEPRFLC